MSGLQEETHQGKCRGTSVPIRRFPHWVISLIEHQCDEIRPQCARCPKIGAECVYGGPGGAKRRTIFEDEGDPIRTDMLIADTPLSHSGSSFDHSPRSDMYSMSVDLLDTDLDLVLANYGAPPARSGSSGNVRLLQHFQSTTFLTLGGPRYTNVFQSSVKNKAWELPYLMHMTLAVSCAHLKRLVPLDRNAGLHQRYALAEALHWQEGLQLYRKAITGSEHDFDGTITATFLSIIFTFALDDDIPQDSFVVDAPEKLMHAVNPLAATGGFRVLRDVLGDRMMDSIWRTVLRDSDDENGTFSTDSPGIAGLPAAFVDLCELGESSTSINNKYHTIVRLLTPLLRLELRIHNFTKLISFSGRTWPHFKPLLFRKDPRALLLISYWFALMRQVDQWWIATRAKTECFAIVNYLCQLGDPKIAALLPFPASLGTADLSYIW